MDISPFFVLQIATSSSVWCAFSIVMNMPSFQVLYTIHISMA